MVKDGEVYMNSPIVSVLMAVYNGEKYLREAVDSILNQTFSDYEFIIVNDGSTDGTSAILENYARRDTRIRLVCNEKNLGLTVSLNKGLKLANGEFVARMDSDDISMPERFEKQVSYLRTHKECLAVGSRIISIDADGDPICREQQGSSHEEIEKMLLRGCGGMAHPAVMFRRETIAALGGYREQFRAAQDVDLWLRLAERGRLANLQECLLKYRRSFKAVSLKDFDLQKSSAESILRDTYQRRGIPLPDDFMAYFPLKRSPIETRLEWSMLATYDGFYDTARKHALGVLKESPLCVDAWRALIRVCVYKWGLRKKKNNQTG